MSSSVQPGKHVDRARVQALTAQMLERDRWPRERLLEYQRDRLQEVVRHAVAHSPYYRQALCAARDGHIDLRQLPILSKATLMAEFDRIVTEPRLQRADLERHASSGAILDEVRVVAVDTIERTGTGAKQKAVGAFA